MHRRQKTDLSLLPRKSGFKTNVSQPLGEASHDVRPAFGLAAMVGLLATNHISPRPGHQLGLRPRIARLTTRGKKLHFQDPTAADPIEPLDWVLGQNLTVEPRNSGHQKSASLLDEV